MKLVIAYIRPEKLTEVKQALLREDITKLSVTNALGCGAEKGIHENYRGSEVEVDLLKRARLEIAINDQYLDRCVDTIAEHAKTSESPDEQEQGDGKIFVLNIADCVRIGDGTRGAPAIG
ncbi:MAG: P-II family nitrogen regulator [Planctomycetota bacterium]